MSINKAILIIYSFGLAHQRQEKVVDCMVELEYITEDECKEIIDSRREYD